MLNFLYSLRIVRCHYLVYSPPVKRAISADTPEKGARGASTPPAFHLGKQGEQKDPFEVQYTPFLANDMIQRISNMVYMQAKYDWKRAFCIAV